LREALRHGVRLEIAALHLIAEIQQHFGDAAHATAADSDEGDGVDTAHAGGFAHRAPPATASHASASRTSASTIATERARIAMSASFARPARSSFCNSSARRG